MIKNLILLWHGLLAVSLICMIILSLFNSSSLSSIGIKLKEGQKEHSDKTIPFLNDKKDKLPDYRISYFYENRWHRVGTVLNTSAADWIDYTISDPPNLSLVQAIRVSDEDKLENDHLEEVQISTKAPAGKIFEYRIETTRSFKSGLAWLATTTLGKTIFAAVSLAVLLSILSKLDFGLDIGL